MSPLDELTLTSGPYRVVATPDGGGLLEFSVAQKRGRRNILRPTSADPLAPLDRAMIVMAPWCNRIGGGGFHVDTRFYSIAPNVAGFPMPLHGTAFQSRWEVIDRQIDRLELRLDISGSADFNYRAKIVYELSPIQLTVDLCVTNTGDNVMPFGVGLHPWFETSDQSRLEFQAARQVLTDSAGLPTRVSPVIDDFTTARALPLARIDKTFLDWDGKALLHHEHGTVQMRSTAPMLHVFSPSSSAGFCCLEPQTAMPNAANFLAGETLAMGGRVSVRMAICFALRGRFNLAALP